ncbi:hypothetical protein GCM10022229_18960 [Luteimonas lutimaris]|uniref:Uncharacterized protein n=1 Tax=Luteimonas lutimaris TaxID=698645 RepID=A0ABP7MKH2_9GAMM
MAARITADVRWRVRDAVALGVPLALVTAYWDITAEQVQAIAESEPTQAEQAARAAHSADVDARITSNKS